MRRKSGRAIKGKVWKGRRAEWPIKESKESAHVRGKGIRELKGNKFLEAGMNPGKKDGEKGGHHPRGMRSRSLALTHLGKGQR